MYEGELAKAVRTALATRTVFTKEIDSSENQRYEDVNEANSENKALENINESSISSIANLRKVPWTRSELILNNGVLKRLPNDMEISEKESLSLSLPVTMIILVISTITVIVIIVTVSAFFTQVKQIKTIPQPIFMVCN